MNLEKLKIDKNKMFNKKNNKKIIAVIFPILAVAIFVLYQTGLISLAKEVEETSASLLYPYQTITVFNASGYVTATKKASVSSKITGKIASLLVEEGWIVKKDQIIAELEKEEAYALKKQAEAQLEMSKKNLIVAKEDFKEAERQFLRYKNLFERGLVPKANYELYETNLNKAMATVEALEAQIKVYSAALEQARVSLENTIIRAPFAGVILTKNADIGDIVTPIGAAVTAKASVVTMADLSTLYVETDVSEAYIEKVKVGQPCIIRLDAFPNKIYRGKVYSIIPTADRTKASITVKISFLQKDKNILPDMSAKVSFLSRELKEEENNPILVVNKKAIIKEKDKNFVFLIKDNRVNKTYVSLGKEINENMEILSGLSYGDKLVLNPPKGLKDRAKVKILEK